ncbi:hypothetical protein AB1Y20_017829 [Prymnesium parvum]
MALALQAALLSEDEEESDLFLVVYGYGVYGEAADGADAEEAVEIGVAHINLHECALSAADEESLTLHLYDLSNEVVGAVSVTLNLARGLRQLLELPTEALAAAPREETREEGREEEPRVEEGEGGEREKQSATLVAPQQPADVAKGSGLAEARPAACGDGAPPATTPAAAPAATSLPPLRARGATSYSLAPRLPAVTRGPVVLAPSSRARPAESEAPCGDGVGSTTTKPHSTSPERQKSWSAMPTKAVTPPSQKVEQRRMYLKAQCEAIKSKLARSQGPEAEPERRSATSRRGSRSKIAPL